MERIEEVHVAEPTFGGQIGKAAVRIHGRELCEGQYCPFHNPSDHSMVDWEKNIRFDKSALVERMCLHGIGHPDPDSAAYFSRQGMDYMGVHGCDGCCFQEDGKGRIDPNPSEPQPITDEDDFEWPNIGDMRLDWYQDQAMTTALGLATGQGDSPLGGAVYCALGLAGEAGEVAEKVKKAWRNETGLEGVKGEKLAYELGDVLWYLSALARSIGYDLETIAEMNVKKLADRAERAKLADEGDER